MSILTSSKAGQGSSRGFTLVEIIVSLAIFSIVAVIAVGALVRILGSNRQAQSLQTSVNNMSFALESMSRELRTGRNYVCTVGSSYSFTAGGTLTPAQCDGTGQGNGVVLAFFSSNVATPGFGANPNCNLVYAYRIVPAGSVWEVDKAEQPDCTHGLASTDFYPIMSSSTALTGYKLIVSKPSGGYAKVFIRLAGYSGTRAQDRRYFDVETAVSERILDQ